MSDIKETPELSLLQQFIQQRDAFIQQSNQLQVQFHQLQGAIFACNSMIEKMEKEAKEQTEELANKDTQGEKVDGEANSEQTEQAA